MAIPDPFKSLENGPLHRADIAIAESVTGVRGRSVSRHMVEPAVRAGLRPSDAIALLHWVIIGVVLSAMIALVTVVFSGSRRRW